MLGTVVSRYRVEEKIGEGGMGVVYRALDLTLNRPVALKFLSELSADAERQRRFQSEAEAASSLNHPHILSVFEVGTHDGQPYLVTEFVAGSTLREWVQQSSPSLRQLLETLVPIAEALATAHGAGLVHRDIKPENVLVATAGYAKLADFGLAKMSSLANRSGTVATQTVTSPGIVVGTVAYMSPEQAVGSPVDHRSDIFSFGVMTYEMLCGVRPFTGTTDIDVLHAIQRVAPPPIVEHRRNVPPELSVAIEKAIEKDPADRYQSMREMVVDLKRALKGRSSGSGGVAPSAPIPPPRSKRSVMWATAAAALVAVVAVMIVWAPWSRADPASRLETLLVGATNLRITDFEGAEFGASIAPDGQLVAFISDRDGPFDALLTRVGSGVFSNLTKGRVNNLYELDVKSVGFSSDGADIWIRSRVGNAPGVTIQSVLGGTARPLVSGGHPTWTPDGRRLAYQPIVSGDPIFVADADGSNGRKVFDATPGIHNHFLTWSADGTGVYAARGYLPDQMDLWKLPVEETGLAPIRLTNHSARVSYPALLDSKTLLYIATATDSADQTLYALDLPSGVSRRITFGVQQYTSVSVGGSADARRLAVTVANPTSQIWTIPISDQVLDDTAATRVAVSTAQAHGPRFFKGAIVYRSSRGGPEGLWNAENHRTTELWKATQGGLMTAPAVSPDGHSIALVVRNQDRATLRVMDADGLNVRTLAPGLDVRDPPTWSRDGRWIAVGADEGHGGRIFKVPIDGGPHVQLVDQLSRAPQWSPDGGYVVYATPTGAPSFTLHAVTPDRKPWPLPDVTIARFEERYHFTPDGLNLIVLGPGATYDFLLIDLTTGKQKRLTAFKSQAGIESFDISPDGKTILFDRVRQNSDIYTIDLKRAAGR